MILINALSLLTKMARRRKTEVKEQESEVPVQEKKTSEETGEVEDEGMAGRPRRTNTKTNCEESSNGDVKQQKILEEENNQETPRQLRRSTRSRSIEKSAAVLPELTRIKRSSRGRGSQSSDQEEDEEEQKTRPRRTRRSSRASSVEEEEEATRSPLRRSSRRRTNSSRSQGEESEEDGGGGGGDIQPGKTKTLESIQELNESHTETPKKTTTDMSKEKEEIASDETQRKAGNKMTEEEGKSSPTSKDENQLETPLKKKSGNNPGKEEDVEDEDKAKKEAKESEGEEGREESSDEERKTKETPSRPKLLRNEVRKVEEKLKLLEQRTRKEERSSSR